MPPEIIQVLLAVMAIAAIALRVSRARRRRSPEGPALPGERQLAWLGDRIDDSVGMWALRSLLGQADPGDHEAGDEPSPTAPTANSGERATADMPTLRERAYGRMPTSGARPGRRLIADTYHREQHGPQAHRQDDPRGRLWRDATLVLLAFMVVAAVVIGVQPTGFLGGVGGVTATPAPVPPVAVMTVSLVATCTADSPATYSFSGATSTEGASYAWAFSSGIAGSTAVTVARDLPGSTAGTTYTITLTVENAVGASDTDSAEITVICP